MYNYLFGNQFYKNMLIDLTNTDYLPNFPIFNRYIEVFRSSLMEAQRAQYGGGGGPRRGGRDGGYGGGYGRGGGRPGPYDRAGPPLGRGFGFRGPGAGGLPGSAKRGVHPGPELHGHPRRAAVRRSRPRLRLPSLAPQPRQESLPHQEIQR